jgi:hypothetical protein
MSISWEDKENKKEKNEVACINSALFDFNAAIISTPS